MLCNEDRAQYSLKIKDWKTDVPADADMFVFKPPAEAKKADLSALAMLEFDELPPGTTPGAKQ
jgi:hypothetical protein